MKRRAWFYKATNVVLWSNGRSSNFSSMVFRFLFGYFRTFLQTLPKFSEGVFGAIHSNDSWLWKEVLGRRIGALHIPRRRFYPFQEENLSLAEGDPSLYLRSFRSLFKEPSGEKKSAPRGKTSFPFGAWRFPTRELIRSLRSYSSLGET